MRPVGPTTLSQQEQDVYFVESYRQVLPICLLILAQHPNLCYQLSYKFRLSSCGVVRIPISPYSNFPPIDKIDIRNPDPVGVQ